MKTTEQDPSRARATHGAVPWAIGGLLLVVGIVLAAWIQRPTAPPAVQPPLGPALPPRVAGQFYPADQNQLKEELGRLLTAAPKKGLARVRAIIVPHAGYVFSAAVAAAAYREIDPSFRTAIILADNHTPGANHSGASIPEAAAMRIPGATIPIASIVTQLRNRHPKMFVHEPLAHESHVIEVHLPFLQAIKGWPERPDYAILPLVLGSMDASSNSELAAILDGEVPKDSILIASTDLSHFLDDASARQIDGATIRTMLDVAPNALPPASCCGPSAVSTVLQLAKKHGWQPHFLAYRNSSDASGDKSRVVGYVAIAFTEPFALDDKTGRALVEHARRVVEFRLRSNRSPEFDESLLKEHPQLREKHGVFVTIKKDGQLRGCIGSLSAENPVCDGVGKFALKAAFEDPRFTPVTDTELPNLEYSVSILTDPAPLNAPPEQFASHLRPGIDGVILVLGGRTSTFLPQVWEELPNPEEFLAHLCLKQGAPPDAWRRPDARLLTYSAMVFGDGHGK